MKLSRRTAFGYDTSRQESKNEGAICNWFAKMAENFSIRIEGTGVSPENLRLGDLREILGDIELALIATAEQAGAVDNELFISLPEIGTGSGVLTFSAAPAMYRAASRVAIAVRDDQLDSLPPRAKRHVWGLWNKAATKDWEIRFEAKNGIPAATISKHKKLFFQTSLFGRTSILARLLRVGGTPNPTAQIQFPDGDKLTVAVAGEKLASGLAPYLYKWASLEGDAEWSNDNWRFLAFKITGIGGYNAGDFDITMAIRELQRVADGHWDGIDPDDYVRELRTE